MDVAAGSFAELLRRCRVAAGLTQEGLAERAGLSVRGISDLERGVKQHPYPHTIERLIGALDLPEDGADRLRRAARHRPGRADDMVEAPASARRPASLPLQPTAFIGRQQEVEEVAAILRREGMRLLTLTGPGGVGKTRLALRVAEEGANAFPDGIIFISLASLTDPALVPAAIAAGLTVKEVSGQSMLESVARHLREKRLLLLLDTFEHLLPATDAVSLLLASCPGLTVLATSRTVLNLAAEHEYPVAPLPTPVPGHMPDLDTLGRYDAVQLFLHRAGAIKPGFRMSEDNAPVIAEICSRLDGLPLAIELAAARLRLFPPQALLERLADRLQLLTGGPQDVPARQRTLRNTLDWSYGLLTSDEQILFTRLSVFAGGCTIGAAEAVCNPAGEIDLLRGLSSLVEHSLLRVNDEEEPRFSMLDTVREYASARLEAGGEGERIRAAHARYFLALTERAEPELRGAQQHVWLARLESEGSNIPAALHWAQKSMEVEAGLRLATALWRFWSTRGHYTEARNRLEALLELDTNMGHPAAPALRAKALNQAARFAERQADLKRALALSSESLALYRAEGDTRGIASALSTAGDALKEQGDYRHSIALLEESLALRREIGDTARVAAALNNLGGVVRWQGDSERADVLFKEALELYTKIGDTAGIAHMVYRLGDIELDRCNFEGARGLYEESLALRGDLKDKEGTGFVLNGLALVAHAQGDFEQAVDLAEHSVALFREVGATRQISCMLDSLARIELSRGNVERAIAAYRESLTLALEAGSKELVPYSLEGLGQIAISNGRPEQAARLYASAMALRESLSTPPKGHEQEAYENALRAIRLALGEEAFGRAWEAGHTVALEDAATYALSTVDGARYASAHSGRLEPREQTAG